MAGIKCRLFWIFALSSIFFFVEIIVGYITNSMCLVAGSFLMLSDASALVVAYISVKMSPIKWAQNTFGWARAEVLGVLVNAIFVLALCFSIPVHQAFQRFIKFETIYNPKLVVIVGGLGLIVTIFGLCLFHEPSASDSLRHPRGKIFRSRNPLTQLVSTDVNINVTNNLPMKIISHGDQINMRAIFVHILSDAIGSVIVISSAVIFWLTDWECKYYIDPVLSLLLVVLIIYSIWPLFRESALILLQTVPMHMQVNAIKQRLLANVDGVLAIHEFHVWQLAEDKIIASVHVRCRNLSEYMEVAEKLKEFFHNEGINSTTIQPEFIDHYDQDNADTEKPEDCVLDCPKTASQSCVQSTCCGPSYQDSSFTMEITAVA